jgi:hypothetical protein
MAAGFLSGQPGTLKAGSSHSPVPLVKSLEAFAHARGLDIEDADVRGWNDVVIVDCQSPRGA